MLTIGISRSRICFFCFFVSVLALASSCASAASWVISSVCLAPNPESTKGRYSSVAKRSNRKSELHLREIWIIMDKIKYIKIRSLVRFLSHSSFMFSSIVVLAEICAFDRTPAPNLHPSPAQCFRCFKASTLGSWLCCFQCCLSASHQNTHISWHLLLNSCDNASFIEICLISFRAFRFMRAVSKRWRTCLSPSRTRRAFRRRSNSVSQTSCLFKQRYSGH